MKKGNVRWDEANLTEINKNKPIRRKITEPKTPYHPMIEEDGLETNDQSNYAAHAAAVSTALEKVALSEKLSQKFVERTSSSSADEPDDSRGSRKERHGIDFQERRKVHYDEFKKMTELRGKRCIPEDNEDDDYSAGESRCYSSPCISSDIRDIHIDDSDDILKIINIEG